MVHLLLRHPVLFALLCDAVARGIIQPVTGLDHSELGLPADEGKKRAKSETPKMIRVPSSLTSSAGQDVLKALKVCHSQENCLNTSRQLPLYLLSLLIKEVVKQLKKKQF